MTPEDRLRAAIEWCKTVRKNNDTAQANLWPNPWLRAQAQLAEELLLILEDGKSLAEMLDIVIRKRRPSDPIDYDEKS